MSPHDNARPPIRTDAEYEEALARAWELMDAEAGTPEGEELIALAAVIEAWEEERYGEDWQEPGGGPGEALRRAAR